MLRKGSIFFIICSLLVLCNVVAWAQQDPQFTHFMFNKMSYNAGYAGSQNKINIGVIGRKQWMGFDGAPQTGAVQINAPFRLLNANHGIGFCAIGDQIGFFKDINFVLSYAYRIKLASGNLGIGVSGYFKNHIISGAEWKVPETGAVHSSSDPYIPSAGDDSYTKGSLNAGIYYQAEDVYLGLSATNLIGPKINYSDSSSSAKFKYKPHYYIIAGYIFQLANPSFDIRPNVNFRYDGAVPQFDINAMLYYNKKVWIGLTERGVLDEAALLFGFDINNIQIGVSYDVNWKMPYNSPKDGSFEVMLNYSFEIQREKGMSKYRSIIYL